MTGRAVHLQFKGQGPVGSLFTGHRLPAKNTKPYIKTNNNHLIEQIIQKIIIKTKLIIKTWLGVPFTQQFKGQGPVGSLFTGHRLPAKNTKPYIKTNNNHLIEQIIQKIIIKTKLL